MIVLKLTPEIRLKGDSWMSKEDWESDFKDNLPALMELLNEDVLAVLEEAGGDQGLLEGLITAAEWVDDGEPGVMQDKVNVSTAMVVHAAIRKAGYWLTDCETVIDFGYVFAGETPKAVSCGLCLREAE